jgi:pyrophosphate--fructose-6-phosphate 1-phosphotransferase
VSLLQKKRLAYKPPVPPLLGDLKQSSLKVLDQGGHFPESIAAIFPHTRHLKAAQVMRGQGKEEKKLSVGVLFSGGQASGGHNVIAGLFDGLKEMHPDSKLFGVLDGPSGLIANKTRELSASAIDAVRNQGGFNLIGSGRTKIETAEQFAQAATHAKKFDAIVVIGGDDSNTNAALLAEYFLEKGISTRVLGVPKTIDGDLRSEDIELPFGFDSACKTYSELIGNLARDAISAKKYYHFIKLMGRSASHITLECALATAPNLALIGEERQSLSHIINDVTDLIVQRKEKGKEYGVILVPEGLIEFIPELRQLVEEGAKSSIFASLSEKLQNQFLTLERDPHGNVNLSGIETEQLLLELVKKELQKRNVKMNTLQHFFGYEGRSCLPSNFDANYCYALGRLAALAAREELTGMIMAIKQLKQPVSNWELKAIPIAQLMHMEMRSGKEKPVIAKALVDLKGAPFLHFAREREKWRLEDCYQMPGPIQFFGDREITDLVPLSLLVS